MTSEGDIRRLERDVEGLATRINVIENASSPYAQQMIGEFRDLQNRVYEFSERGTPHSRRELVHLEKELARIDKAINTKADADEVHAIQEETRSNRTMVRSAFFAAIASLSVGIILYLIQRGGS
jgi:hypothetical protein